MNRFKTLTILLLLSVFVVACSETKKAPDPNQGPTSSESDLSMQRPGVESFGLSGPAAAEALTDSGYRILFDYDSSIIRSDYATLLSQNAQWLRGNSVPVTVEGHCDERGTREYNLALGQKRADAIKQFLVGQGVAASRITTISYGKERALMTGHDEFAWSKNRRGEIILR